MATLRVGAGLTFNGVTGDVNFTGITTAVSSIVGSAVTINASGINASGVITATSFSGSGANLTGVAATSNISTNAIVNSGVTTVAAGSASVPSISPTGDSDTGIFFPSADTIAFGEGGAEAARIDSSGRLVIGTTSANGKLCILQADTTNLGTATDGAINIASTSGGAVGRTNSINFLPGFNVSQPTASIGYICTNDALFTSGDIFFATRGNTGNNPASERMRIDSNGYMRLGDGTSFYHTIRGGGGNEALEITANAGQQGGTTVSTIKFLNSDTGGAITERMRITNGGEVLFGTTSIGGNPGITFQNNGFAAYKTNGITVLEINRYTSDGTLVEFRQDNVTEGSISVSGNTVSYNGGHLSRWSQLPGGAERTEILRGSVLSNLDEMCEWGDEENEQLNRMKVSDVEGDKNVSGVFQCWDDDDDTYTNDFYCAMTGDFIIRIAEGVTVERGDLLMSAGDGTAKPQDDDIIRSKTIAKVTSTNVSCTYEDGSYCVPCVLMAC